MTTLATGASISVSLRDDGICRIASNGGFATIVITPTVGSASVVSIGPEPTRQAFGPFAEGASLVLTNRSCGSFDYESPAVDLANVVITGGTVGVAIPVTTSRSLSASDSLSALRCNSASTISLTLPSGLPNGFSCAVVQMGAGKITIVAGSGVTLNSTGSLFSSSGQYTTVGLIQTATDEYVLSGQLGN